MVNVSCLLPRSMTALFIALITSDDCIRVSIDYAGIRPEQTSFTVQK